MKKYILFIMLVLIQMCSQVKALDFQQFNINDINALNKAVKAYQKEYKHKKGTSEAEKAYFEFVEFYENFLAANDVKISDECLKYKNELESGKRLIIKSFIKTNLKARKDSVILSFPEIEKILSTKYYKYGININFNTDEFYPTISNKYIYKNIAPYLSIEWREYLANKINSDRTTIIEGYYIVPKTYIEKEILFYEYLIDKYPEFCNKNNIDKDMIEDIKRSLKIYPCVYNSYTIDGKEFCTY